MRIRRDSEALHSTAVYIHWIPSHLGSGGQRIMGNEAADAIAKTARDSSDKEIFYGDLCAYDQISDMSATLVYEIESLYKHGPSNDDIGNANPLQVLASKQVTV